MQTNARKLTAAMATVALGIGTAGRADAALCSALGAQPVVFIETNIRRVCIHFFFSDTAAVNDAEILPIVQDTLYREDPRTWYNALMDLGTSLKKTVPNPNRRSVHYTKQSAFEGSDREIRGWILKSLIAGKKITDTIIMDHFPGDPPRIRRIIAALEAEGFIVQNEDFLTLSS